MAIEFDDAGLHVMVCDQCHDNVPVAPRPDLANLSEWAEVIGWWADSDGNALCRACCESVVTMTHHAAGAAPWFCLNDGEAPGRDQ